MYNTHRVRDVYMWVYFSYDRKKLREIFISRRNRIVRRDPSLQPTTSSSLNFENCPSDGGWGFHMSLASIGIRTKSRKPLFWCERERYYTIPYLHWHGFMYIYINIMANYYRFRRLAVIVIFIRLYRNIHTVLCIKNYTIQSIHHIIW